MRVSPLFCAVLSAIAFIQPVSGASGQGPWTIDWSGGEVDQPVSKETAPNFTSAPIDSAHRVMVVGRSSEVPNPFPDIEKALLIERGDNTVKVPILRWSLGKEGRTKGAFEVQFVMVDGTEGGSRKALRFYIGSVQERNGRPHFPNAGHVRIMGNGVAFHVPEEADFRSVKIKPRDGVNTLRIEWDLLDKGGFWAFLNGEPLRVNGETAAGPSVIPIPSDLRTAIGNVTLMMMYPQTKAFIGKVSVE